LLFAGFLLLFGIVAARGKTILVDVLANNFKTEVKVDYVSLGFPFTIEIGNFNCGDIAFKKARITPGVFNPFGGVLTLGRVEVEGLTAGVKIYRDKIAVTPFFEQKFSVKTVVLPRDAFSIFSCAYAQNAPGRQQPMPFNINNFSIKDSTVTLYDLASNTGSSPAQFVFTKVSADIKDLSYPALTKFYLDVNASMASQDITLENLLNAKGFVDLSRKDMDVDASINNFDYLILRDYYSAEWKPESLGLKKALVSLKAKLVSVNNDLDIKADFTVDNVEFTGGGEKSSKSDRYRTIFSLANGGSGKFSFSFQQQTKMDAPKLDFKALGKQFTKSAGNNALGNILGNVLSGDGDAIDNIKNLFKIKKKHKNEPENSAPPDSLGQPAPVSPDGGVSPAQ